VPEEGRRERLPDWKAREDAVRSRGVNLVVEASAGTGKTHLLVERVISFAAGGEPVDGLAVVTFTESAAAELRSRIRRGLAGMKPGPAKNDALRKLPSAFVGTIHGFASKVLRDYFYLTQVDPSFSAGAAAFPGMELERLWDRYLAGLPAGTIDGCSDLLLSCRDLPETALKLACMPWVEWPACFFPGGSWARASYGPWLGECRRIHEIARKADPVDGLASCLTNACPKLEELLGAQARLGMIRPLLQGIGFSRTGHTRWPSRDVLDDVKAACTAMKQALPSSILTDQFGQLVWPFVEELRSLRRSDRSSLTFEDLLYRCHSALAAQPALRDLVAERFRIVMIDEFQDTSGIQARLFSGFLSHGGEVGPGRLTVVGDPKQSIYGWRDADIETFKSTVDGLEKNGALRRSIEVSNRSTRNIVEFVNAFGEALFADPPPEERRYACGYARLVPHPLAEEGRKVTIAWVPRFGNAPVQRRREAAWLASYLLRETDGGAKADGWAVLLRSMGDIDIFIQAFEAAGLPWNLDSSRDFRNRPETADLRALLTTLLSPSDRIAFCTVLRSPFFGVSDGDITLALGKRFETWLEPPEGLPASVAGACGLLRNLREIALASPPAELMHAILYGTSLAAVIAASRWQSGRRLSNLRYLLGWCLSGGASSTADLLEGLGRDGQGSAAIEDPSSPPSLRDSILLGTIHGSKGLTYRNVVYVSTQKGRGSSAQPRIDEKLGLAAVSFGDGLGTPYLEDLEASYAQRENAESRRLAYVAATRAAKRLTILAHQEAEEAKGFLPGLVRSASEAALDGSPGCVESIVVEPVELPCAARLVLPHERAGSGPAPRMLPVAVKPATDPESPEILLGNAVHSILEVIDLKDPEGWISRNLGRSILPRGVDPERAAELARSLFRLRNLPVDLASAGVEREYPFMALDGNGRPGQNRVDLLAESGGMLYAIDYKTDNVSTEAGILERMDCYRPGQEEYGRILSDALGREVSVWLALLVPCEARKIGDYSPRHPRRRPART
jgi:ATP-dependent helicase/nuclease subunit A